MAWVNYNFQTTTSMYTISYKWSYGLRLWRTIFCMKCDDLQSCHSRQSIFVVLFLYMCVCVSFLFVAYVSGKTYTNTKLNLESCNLYTSSLLTVSIFFVPGSLDQGDLTFRRNEKVVSVTSFGVVTQVQPLTTRAVKNAWLSSWKQM